MYISAVTTISKFIVLAVDGNIALAMGWLIAGSWIIFIGVSLHTDKDLPMVGDFRFCGGSNQVGRYIAALAMTSIFLIAAVVSK